MNKRDLDRRRRKRWWIALGSLLVLIGGAATTLWVMLPGYVEGRVRRAAEKAADLLGVTVSIGSVELESTTKVRIRGIVIAVPGAPAGEAPLLEVPDVLVEIDEPARRPRLVTVELTDFVATGVRRAAGADNLDVVLERVRKLMEKETAAGPAGPDEGIWSMIDRHIPEVRLAGGTVVLLDESAARTLIPAALPKTVRLLNVGGNFRSGTALRERLELEATLSATLAPLGAEGRLQLSFDGGADRLKVEASLARPFEMTVLGARLKIERAVWHGAETLQLGGVSFGPELTTDAIAITFQPGFKPVPGGHLLLSRLARIDVTRPTLRLTADGALPAWMADLPAAVSASSPAGGPAGANPPLGTRPKLDAERGARVRAGLVRLFAGVTDRAAAVRVRVAALASRWPSLTVVLDEARVLRGDAPTASSPPFDVRIGEKPDGLVSLELDRATPAEHLHVSIVRQTGELKTELHTDDLSLEVAEELFGEVFQRARLVDTDGSIAVTADGTVRVKGRFNISGLRLVSPSIAPGVIELPTIGADGEATLSPLEDAWTFVSPAVRLGDVRASLELGLRDLREAPVVQWNFNLPSTQAQTIVRAIPAAILGPLDGMALDGTITWKLAGRVDLRDPTTLDYKSDAGSQGFTVRSLGDVNLAKVSKAFTIPIIEANGSDGEMSVGPGSKAWTPLSEVSPWMAKVLTTTEDGSFFNHRGISLFAIRDAIIQNLEQGRFYRGASTLTQQLVKNVFLQRKKTVARKLQEMFVAWRLEKQVGKERILELYVNVVELGPGIYGIKRAARYYFDKTPKDLDVVECAFIASLLPSPRKFHNQFKRGEVSEGWRLRLKKTLDVMRDRGKLTQPELEAAAPYSPVFRRKGG